MLKQRLTWFLFLLSFFYPLTLLVGIRSSSFLLAIYILIALIITHFLPVSDNKQNQEHEQKKIYFLWSFVPAIIVFSYLTIVVLFGAFDFSAVLYHLEMGFGGGRPTIRGNRLAFLIISAVLFFVCALQLRRRYGAFRYVDITLAGVFLFANPVFWKAGEFYLSKPNTALIDQYQTPPIKFKDNSNPKNILMIYAESAERTFAEINRGSEIYQDMLLLAEKGIDARSVRQIANTGWTMAGFVASQCGVPLQPRGFYQGNNFRSHSSFYANVICLSDILSENGYHNEFLNGGAANYAGIGTFLDNHKYYRHTGLEDYEYIVGDYINSFGLYDDTLFDIATDRIRALAKADKPYAFTMQTIAGHSPNGFPTQACEENMDIGTLSPMQFSIKCTAYHITSFLKQLEDEGLLENTIVLVQSDHFVMGNEHSEELDTKKRANFFSLSGPDIQPVIIDREAAMFDIYPTILEAMGMELKNGKAGIGVSLLSKEQNLTEIYGEEKLNSMIRKDRLLGEMLWQGYGKEMLM